LIRKQSKKTYQMTDFQAMEAVRPAINKLILERHINSTEALGILLAKLSGYDVKLFAKIVSIGMIELQKEGATV